MPELNLPVIRETPPAARRLSMEDYLEFINLQLRYTIVKKIVREGKRSAMVNVKFFLKENIE